MATINRKTPNITAKHPDYKRVEGQWLLIRDVLEGQERIKSRRKVYLPLPETEADPTENEKRYRQYLEKAVFYNITSRTLEGLTGQVFSKDAEVIFPDSATYLKDDPAGTGITLQQQAKDAMKDLLGLGRGFLWVDYPKLATPASVADIESGVVRPTITYYRPEDVLNWRTMQDGARTKLSLVVLRERYVAEDDGFDMVTAYQYRELRLVDGVYTVRVWRSGGQRTAYEAYSTSVPRDSKDELFDEIPGVFLGIEGNDWTVDKPPLYDMAVLNIAHYRNSADYEESVFMVGQPTVWFAGVTEEWNTNVLKGRIWLGSRGGIPLPVSGSAGLLQAESNGLANEAMLRKEEQMVAIGARLVQSSGVRRTATEVVGDKVSEVSVLASAAMNTSEAYARAFAFVDRFLPIGGEIKYILSTDFEMSRMTSQDLLAIFTVWTGRLLTTAEARAILKRAGYATETLEAAIADGVQKVPESALQQKNVDNNARTSQD